MLSCETEACCENVGHGMVQMVERSTGYKNLPTTGWANYLSCGKQETLFVKASTSQLSGYELGSKFCPFGANG